MVQEAVVVGGGVSGLTSAVRLAEAGISTSIVTRERALQSTSVVAAAIWFPEPGYYGLMAVSLRAFRELSESPGTGVYDIDITEYTKAPLEENPPWAADLRHYQILDDVPGPFVAGHVLGSVRIEPPIYLPYLEQRLGSLDVSVVEESVSDLDDLAGPERVVVNCTGLGSRELIGDDTLYPVRGQVVHVRNSGIVDGYHLEIAGEPLTYSLPRNDVIVLGGTRLVGDENTDPRQVTTDEIMSRNRTLDQRLSEAEVVDVKVGLRPGRPRLRLEREETAAGPVIHNYGHDGNGYGLSWGCADEVARLATS
jgi:D-amino-acid oxidase